MDGADDFEDIIDDSNDVEEDIDCDDYDEDEEEDIAYISTGGNSGEDDLFDAIVGKLEEIIMEDDFHTQTTTFMRTHCTYFDRSEEQKLEYMDVYTKYTTLIEDHIELGLRDAIPDFSMEKFLEMLEKRRDEVSEDVIDMLISMSDFEIFKESMLEYKEQCVENTGCLYGLVLNGKHTTLHYDDMEDGDERPDLMDGLCIAPLSPQSALKNGLDGPPAFGVMPFRPSA